MVDFRPYNGYIAAMYKRNITPDVLAALTDSPVILLNGARQTGKSTLAQQLISKNYPARYLTLDDIDVLAAARADPASFINGFSEPLILDEIQRAPELFLAIKAAVDRKRTPGRFLLTGSANVLLLPQLADSLAGRMEILTLWPLSQGEIEQTKEKFIDTVFSNSSLSIRQKRISHPVVNIIDRIVKGGYPEPLNRSAGRQKVWFNSYLMSILERDVRELANIEGLSELPQLLNLLAVRTASLLNYAELSRSIKLPQTTLKRYLTLLETVFLIQYLPAWSNNLGKRLVKAPKVMLNDTGLLSYLLNLNSNRLENDRQLLGPLVENFVVTELRKQSTWSETQPRFFHFRTQNGHEVDLIMENAEGKIVAIEIKAKTALNSEDFKGLQTLSETLGKKLHRGLLLYLGSNSVAFGKNLYTVPIHALWET